MKQLPVCKILPDHENVYNAINRAAIEYVHSTKRFDSLST